MRGIVIAMPCYSGSPAVETRDSLKSLGYVRVYEVHGCSDVALARNRVLTSVVASADSWPEVDTALLVDADMAFTPEHVAVLVDMSRRSGRAVSAIYGTSTGRLAGCSRDDIPGWTDETGHVHHGWLMGLGLMAIPIKLLRRVAAAEGLVRGPRGKLYPLCTSGPWRFDLRGAPIAPYWESEDFSLCRRLGGVLLAPIGVGHVKSVPLWPDEQTIAAVASGAKLPAAPEESDESCPQFEPVLADVSDEPLAHTQKLYAGATS